MASKRSFPQEEEKQSNESLVPHTKRSRLFNLGFKAATGFGLLESFASKQEPWLRGAVRDEIQKVFLNYVQPSLRSSTLQVQQGVRFHLNFQNSLPRTLFTGKHIKAEHDMPIQIVIKDANSQTVTHGPLSSLKIKIVVVKGDFNSDGESMWSQGEFESHIISERLGKRPLLTGELNIKMHNGVGCIVGASFTDNSSWMRSGKFRLGALVYDGGYTGERIQEAITEAFRVKDGRVESSQKDHPPSLNDEVCRLKKIQKNGAFHKKLINSGINTVQDFLRAHIMDPKNLRALLGRGMLDKWWQETLEHASQCSVGNNHYSYCVAGEGIDLVFNAIFELLGVNIDGVYHAIDNLSTSLMNQVSHYKNLAYKNPGDIVDPVENLQRPLPTMNAVSVPGTSLPDTHNAQSRASFHASTSHVEIQHQAYASSNELSNDITQPRFHQLHKSAAVSETGSFRHQSDKCTDLFIPGPCPSLMPNVQPTQHDEAMSCQVVSSRQDHNCMHRSASFASNKFIMNSINKQNQGLQSHTTITLSEEPSMSEEQLRAWVADLIQSPDQVEICTSSAPSSPRSVLLSDYDR